MLKDKKILLGVTGGISAYKAIDLASRLTKAGAVVRTILTKNAQEFVTALNFAAITGNPVLTKEFQLNEPIAHVDWAGWADLIVVAPATGNILAKAANGIADDLLSSTLLASPKPIFFAPAMNIYMYANKATQNNVETLRSYGHYLMEPASGMLACGYEGKGRLPEPAEIVQAISIILNSIRDLVGKKLLITAGASRESIDPMRFITNHSTGKMGLALAIAAYWRGAEVTLIHSWIDQSLPEYIKAIKALTADEMYNDVFRTRKDQDAIIMTAAVADYSPAQPQSDKIKKSGDLSLELVRTKDILADLGNDKQEGQILVGFAAESENLNENAKAKLHKKNLDYIVANDLAVSGMNETNINIISQDSQIEFAGSKLAAANQILDTIFKV